MLPSGNTTISYSRKIIFIRFFGKLVLACITPGYIFLSHNSDIIWHADSCTEHSLLEEYAWATLSICWWLSKLFSTASLTDYLIACEHSLSFLETELNIKVSALYELNASWMSKLVSHASNPVYEWLLTKLIMIINYYWNYQRNLLWLGWDRSLFNLLLH